MAFHGMNDSERQQYTVGKLSREMLPRCIAGVRKVLPRGYCPFDLAFHGMNDSEHLEDPCPSPQYQAMEEARKAAEVEVIAAIIHNFN